MLLFRPAFSVLFHICLSFVVRSFVVLLKSVSVWLLCFVGKCKKVMAVCVADEFCWIACIKQR